MKLIKYLSVLQVKLLSIFNQTENDHIFLAEIETTIQHRLTDKNAQKHNFLTETVKSLSV